MNDYIDKVLKYSSNEKEEEIIFNVTPIKKLFLDKIIENKIDKLEDLENTDLTEIFWENIDRTVEQGHLSVTGIGGEVTLGKSTVGLEITIRGCKILEKLGHNKFWYSTEEFEDEFNKKAKKDYSEEEIKDFILSKDLDWIKRFALNKEIKKLEIKEKNNNLDKLYNKIKSSKIYVGRLIASDLVEGNRIDLNIGKHVFRQNDESGETSSKTGANVFTEGTTFIDENDMSAQKGRHKVLISPRAGSPYDSVTPIKLETHARDNEKMITTCILRYDNIYGADRQLIPLGVVHFYVKDMIYNWIKHVKPVFEKNNENITLEEWKEVRKWAKKDMYVEYHMKKHARLDLTEYYGKNGIKELEDSEITMLVFNETKDLCQGFNQISQGIIKVHRAKILAKNKLRWSMVGKDEVDSKVIAYLTLLNDIKKHEEILESGKLTTKRILNPKEKEKMKGILKKEKETLKDVLEIEQNNINILKQYRSIY
jgi:hypothetical protein